VKKPNKREFLVALVFCAALISAAVYVNTLRPSEYYGGLTVQPQGLSAEELKQQWGLSGPTTQTSPTESERVKDIRQWIRGELKNGTFEEVVMSIEDETESLGGYVDSEDVTFTEDLWSGEIVSKIPQNNSLRFVFKARSLISANGKVVSITTNIRDVTPPSDVTIEKPLATIRFTLIEVLEKPSQPGFPSIEFPFLASIVPYLGTFFAWVITGIVFGLPAYFTILGIVVFINRALLPLASKLFKKA
jgi:hypothetical protein